MGEQSEESMGEAQDVLDQADSLRARHRQPCEDSYEHQLLHSIDLLEVLEAGLLEIDAAAPALFEFRAKWSEREGRHKHLYSGDYTLLELQGLVALLETALRDMALDETNAKIGPLARHDEVAPPESIGPKAETRVIVRAASGTR
jgi:hypothetical protein